MFETQVRIVDENGMDVTKNNMEVGKIVVKGESVLSNDTQPSTQDGWVETGDFGTMDTEGKVHVVQRKADIHSNEDPLSTVSLERILTNHEAIQEVSVIAQPDKVLGEIPHAFVVLVPDHLTTKSELLSYVKRELSSEKITLKITILEELPKTFSGKILKNQLG